MLFLLNIKINNILIICLLNKIAFKNIFMFIYLEINSRKESLDYVEGAGR